MSVFLSSTTLAGFDVLGTGDHQGSQPAQQSASGSQPLFQTQNSVAESSESSPSGPFTQAFHFPSPAFEQVEEEEPAATQASSQGITPFQRPGMHRRTSSIRSVQMLTQEPAPPSQHSIRRWPSVGVSPTASQHEASQQVIPNPASQQCTSTQEGDEVFVADTPTSQQGAHPSQSLIHSSGHVCETPPLEATE